MASRVFDRYLRRVWTETEQERSQIVFQLAHLFGPTNTLGLYRFAQALQEAQARLDAAIQPICERRPRRRRGSTLNSEQNSILILLLGKSP